MRICLRSRFAKAFGLCVLALPAAWSQSPSTKSEAPEKVSSPDNYANEALVIERTETTYKYNLDGTGEKVTSVRMRIQNEAGAREFSVLSLAFASATETVKVDSLVVHHPDGTSTETPASDGMEMPAPVTQQAPLYSDLKMLQLPVRGLRSGDVLEYRSTVAMKNSEAAEQFWGNYAFARNMVMLSEKVTLDLPASKYVQYWSGDLKPAVTESGGRRVLVWTSNQLKPTPSKKKTDEDSSEETKEVKPDVAWTTFHSWAEVGDWYRSLASARAEATDAIRARAEETTRGATTPEAQVQALYAYVSTRIRYVGIDFGVGRYQPHPAGEVLANQYGDCKDKDTLLEALLRAKGFSTAPALVGANLKLIAEVPSPSFFNHVITSVNLSSGRVWVDSTPGVAPYRMLVEPVRDKEVLLIPAKGNATLERTPADPPFPFVDKFDAAATLKKDGELNGRVNITDRSDGEILIRALAIGLAPAQWDRGSQLLANAMGFSGTTSNTKFEHPEDVAQPIHVSYDYNRKPFGDWDNFRIIPLFPVNALPAVPEKEPGKEIDLGMPRTESALSRIHLPEGFGADLPDAIHVKTAFATFDKTYKLENGDLIAERQLVVVTRKLPAKSWEEYKKFAKDISLADEPWIQLTAKEASEEGAHPPKPGENSPQAASLVSEANNLEQRRDWATAKEKLDEARKLNEEQPYLWSNYGYLAMVQNRSDEAKEDYRHELAHHADEPFVVQLFAGYLLRLSEKDEARSVLKTYFDHDQSDIAVSLMYANSKADDDVSESIAILRKADKAKPDNTDIETVLSALLVRNHQKTEAAEVAGKMLAGAGDDPSKLNNAAYSLAEADGDLAAAEKGSRQSIDILEGQTAQAAVSEANQQSFARTSLMIASWDTLGYILLREKKNDEATDYLEAAWRNTPSLAIGLHYGNALDASGKHAEALHVYELTASQVHGKPDKDPDWQELEANRDRLKSGETKDELKTARRDLQEDRTFKITVKAACKSFASSTYRLQVSASAAAEVLRVSGETAPADVEESIRGLKFPHLVPGNSKGKVIRDAVFTCSQGKTEGYLVLMPMGGIAAERVGQ